MDHELIIKTNHRMSIIGRYILPEILNYKIFIPSVAKAAKKGNTIVNIANRRQMQLLIETMGA